MSPPLANGRINVRNTTQNVCKVNEKPIEIVHYSASQETKQPSERSNECSQHGQRK